MSTSHPPCTLHHLDHSQSLRVLWALEELSPLEYNLKLYNRIQGRAPPELKQIYPLGKSPILTVDPVAGSNVTEKITVPESRLVIKYIADNYSNGVWVQDSASDRFRDDYWTEFANNTLGAILMLVMVFDIIPSQSPWVARPLMNVISKGAVTQISAELVKPYELMEAALSESNPWFAGKKLGVADFNMSWPMDMATQRGYFDASKYPKTAEWLKRVHARPAYQRALEKGGKYSLATFGVEA